MRWQEQGFFTPESGAWLCALPVANLELRMGDSSIWVAVGLRLGLPLTRPHSCCHCSAMVDGFVTHPLSCIRPHSCIRPPSLLYKTTLMLSLQCHGRWVCDSPSRHSTVNSIIHRAFAAAGIPARLEPTGLLQTDEKRPDEVTVAPWECGKCAVLDFTCPDALAPSYRAVAISTPGSVSAWAEMRKMAQ